MNKYLEKCASRFTSTVKGVKDNRGALTGAILGGTAGGYFGTKGKVRDSYRGPLRNKTKTEKILSGITLGGVGAVYGGSFGARKDLYRKFGKDYFKQYRSYYSNYYSNRGYGGHGSSGGSFTRGATIHDIHKDLGTTGFKTKTEAHTHFRRQASKWHPDKHTGDAKAHATAQMQKINAAWTEYKKHPEGFEKLANSYLEKVSSTLSMGFRKGKDLIRNKPLTAPIKGAGLAPEKPMLKKPPAF